MAAALPVIVPIATSLLWRAAGTVLGVVAAGAGVAGLAESLSQRDSGAARPSQRDDGESAATIEPIVESLPTPLAPSPAEPASSARRRPPDDGDSARPRAPAAAADEPAPAGAAAGASTPPRGPGSEDEDGQPQPKKGRKKDKTNDQKLLEMLRKLIEELGGKIYKEIKRQAGAEYSPGSQRTMWDNQDFRADAGHLDRQTGIRSVAFQVNRQASKAIKKLLDKNGTHKQLFRHDFNTKNPRELEEWMADILKELDKAIRKA